MRSLFSASSTCEVSWKQETCRRFLFSIIEVVAAFLSLSLSLQHQPRVFLYQQQFRGFRCDKLKNSPQAWRRSAATPARRRGPLRRAATTTTRRAAATADKCRRRCLAAQGRRRRRRSCSRKRCLLNLLEAWLVAMEREGSSFGGAFHSLRSDERLEREEEKWTTPWLKTNLFFASEAS